MFKVNKLIILGILVVALVALSGTASAYSSNAGSLTFTLDSVTRNGHYIGEPVILGDAPGHYGYNYVFIPDGTYTVKLHVTNDALVPVNGYTYVFSPTAPPNSVKQEFTIPAAGDNPARADFALTMTAPNSDNLGCVVANSDAEIGTYLFYYGDHLDIVDAADTSHTFDEGPMSGQVAIYKDGKITYSGSPLFIVDFVY